MNQQIDGCCDILSLIHFINPCPIKIAFCDYKITISSGCRWHGNDLVILPDIKRIEGSFCLSKVGEMKIESRIWRVSIIK
jgi:hypothetical protein